MQNEILKPVLETDETAIPRYDIVNPDGSVTQQNVELRLKNQVMQEGTPYSEESVLPVNLRNQLGLPKSATPADAFNKIYSSLEKFYTKDEINDKLAKIGDIKITARTDLPENWLLCNGAYVHDNYADLLNVLNYPEFKSKGISSWTNSNYSYNGVKYNGEYFFCADDTGVMYSSEFPFVWEHYTISGISGAINCFDYANGYYIAVTTNGYVYYSRELLGTYTKSSVTLNEAKTTSSGSSNYNKTFSMFWDGARYWAYGTERGQGTAFICFSSNLESGWTALNWKTMLGITGCRYFLGFLYTGSKYHLACVDSSSPYNIVIGTFTETGTATPSTTVVKTKYNGHNTYFCNTHIQYENGELILLCRSGSSDTSDYGISILHSATPDVAGSWVMKTFQPAPTMNIYPSGIIYSSRYKKYFIVARYSRASDYSQVYLLSLTSMTSPNMDIVWLSEEVRQNSPVYLSTSRPLWIDDNFMLFKFTGYSIVYALSSVLPEIAVDKAYAYIKAKEDAQ